jgi:hypothetical protein
VLKSIFRFGGRESIWQISHTNEFCGKSECGHESTSGGPLLKNGRRVYEKEGKKGNRDSKRVLRSRELMAPADSNFRTLSCRLPISWLFEQACRLRSRSRLVIVGFRPSQSRCPRAHGQTEAACAAAGTCSLAAGSWVRWVAGLDG